MTEIEKRILEIHNGIKDKCVQKGIKLIQNGELSLFSLGGRVERSFVTIYGNALQEIAACGDSVINLDKNGKKQTGIDLRTSFGEGQLKTGKTTQCGTHKKDSLRKLLDTTTRNGTNPFNAIAFGESQEYVENDILNLHGEAFWSKIGIDYEFLVKEKQKLWRDIEREVTAEFRS